jgi:hypothetical protein
MPKVDWGIDAAQVDEFDREKQFKPYTGPVPPVNTVYRWRIKVLKYIAATGKKHPQMRIGLELVERQESERRYRGFFLMDFPPITDSTKFRYVPFLDAIGVNGRDFAGRTIIDTDGNIKKIGAWRNDGEQTILAMFKMGADQNGDEKLEFNWYGPDEDLEGEEAEADNEEYAEDDEDDAAYVADDDYEDDAF